MAEAAWSLSPAREPASADVRHCIADRGLKSRIDVQNVDTEAAVVFAALGGARAGAVI